MRWELIPKITGGWAKLQHYMQKYLNNLGEKGLLISFMIVAKFIPSKLAFTVSDSCKIENPNQIDIHFLWFHLIKIFNIWHSRKLIHEQPFLTRLYYCDSLIVLCTYHNWLQVVWALKKCVFIVHSVEFESHFHIKCSSLLLPWVYLKF